MGDEQTERNHEERMREGDELTKQNASVLEGMRDYFSLNEVRHWMNSSSSNIVSE